MLIFVLQTIWLYIRELSGKDLDIGVIFKFLFYFTPKLIPLVLPLTILLASIMVFGSFAENYEFAAMKSTGISLQRAMSGLSIFIIILGITTFFFSNNVIPWAEFKSFNLRTNIAKSKPAMLLVKGQFNEVNTYNIKFDNKHGERDQYLDNVTIHVKGNDGRKNATTIKSKTGELVNEKDSNVLKLILLEGNYYTDVSTTNPASSAKKPFAKSTFEKYIVNIDLSQMGNVDFDEQSQTDKYNMLDIIGLNKTIDSLNKKEIAAQEVLATNLYQRSNIVINNNVKIERTAKDSMYLGPILDVFNTKNKYTLVDASLKTILSGKQVLETNYETKKIAKEWLNKHIISLHEKFALGFACIILFFVGAPLGALIRKGGIGLPMVIAIVLFLTYHFIGIFATNSARNGSFNPILAAWFSTLIMLPLGVFLTRRATADKGLLDFDSISEPLKKVFKIKEPVDYRFLYLKKNDELLDVINNFETLGLEEDTRYEAVKILNERDLTTKQLREEGLQININYEISQKIAKDYSDHSKFAVILYWVGVLLLILYFVFKNNKLPAVASASIQLSIIALILYIIYYIKSLINTKKFYKGIVAKVNKPSLILLIIGIPFYFIVYLFLNDKVKTDMKKNCLESLK